MHNFNATNVLINRVDCSGKSFILTLFLRVLRDLRPITCTVSGMPCFLFFINLSVWLLPIEPRSTS